MHGVIVSLILSLLALGVRGDISNGYPLTGSCLCIDGNRVNIRATPCGMVIGSDNSGNCFTYLGTKTACVLSGTTYQFFETQYGSGSGWIAGTYLNVGTETQCSGEISNSAAGPQIVSRSQWRARAPKNQTPLRHPAPRVVIHHTHGGSCTNQAACSGIVKGIQNYHMDTRKWWDIGYNFLVGEDGRVYEGVGWNRVGAHTLNYNSQAIGISVMGSYMTRVPNSAALAAVQQLIASGVQQGKISSTYTLHGHRDLGSTSCPGNAFYAIVRTWPRYKGRP